MPDRALDSRTETSADDATRAVAIGLGVTTRRDSGLTVLILGLFSAAWSSWTPEASGALAVALRITSVAAVVVAIVGGLRAVAAPSSGGVLGDSPTSRRYGRLVGVEVSVGGAGTVVLVAVGAAAFVPVWICAVVGVHFFPLAAVLRAPLMRWLGAATTTVAIAGLIVGVATGVAPSTVTGTGVGALLLGYSILVLVGADHRLAPRVTN